ncbi:MAG: helix-turn-helix transcriptional regulator [Lachnospiraceae bacterium]|nr:helix-turn-helix transcriptional regulator [Lachnospiraceae bacterium]
MQYYDKKAVGERIKILRKSRALTQSKLSDYLDYTNERQLQRIENGETACSVDKLMEIAQILDVSTDFLLFGTEIVKNGCEIEMFAGKSEK